VLSSIAKGEGFWVNARNQFLYDPSITASPTNVSPVANAGAAQNVLVGSVVTLDGSASSDANGDPLTYAWTLSSKPIGSAAVLASLNSAKPTFTADMAGNYVASLTVNDGMVSSNVSTVQVTANIPNVPPIANAGVDQYVTAGAYHYILDGSGSSDANGDTLTYQWTFVSVPVDSSPQPFYSGRDTVNPDILANVPGTYVVSLVVSDGKVSSTPSTVSIIAAPVNLNAPPIASAGAAQNVRAGSVVTLDGSASFDPNGDTITYAWTLTSKPDGSAAALSLSTSATPSFIADMAGTYVASLTVNDGQVNSTATTVVILVIPPSPFIKLSAGLNHTYALQADGVLWAWGENLFSQIGDGTTTNRLSPVKIDGVFQDINAGAGNATAIKSDGSIWTWGRDDWGQQGNGPIVGSVAIPTQIWIDFAKVYSGYFHSYGVKVDGALWGWGENDYGQIGDGSTVNRTTPTAAIFGSDFVSIAGGVISNYGLKSDGTLWAWGNNVYGQLGDGTSINRQFPVLVGSSFVSVVAGDLSAFGVKSDGTLWAWGNNSGGQLGDGTRISRNTPLQIGTGFSTVSSGGYGSNVSISIDNFGNLNTTYSAGGAHTLAIKSDGSLWAWGENTHGELGDGTTIQRSSPVKIGDGFIATVAGGYAENAHSVAIKADGSVWAWGGNVKGQVGDGTTTMRLTPVRIF
jgi:alpha-tubulin suppressor-like RCC1 family protein